MKDIVIIIAALALTGFSLYRKYAVKKNGQEQKPANELTASGKENDYEPYSGK